MDHVNKKKVRYVRIKKLNDKDFFFRTSVSISSAEKIEKAVWKSSPTLEPYYHLVIIDECGSIIYQQDICEELGNELIHVINRRRGYNRL